MSSPFQKAFSAKSPLGYVSIQPAIASAYKAAEGHISDLKDLKGKENQKEAFSNIGKDADGLGINDTGYNSETAYTKDDYDIDYPKATSTSSESQDAKNNAEAKYWESLIKNPNKDNFENFSDDETADYKATTSDYLKYDKA